MRIWNCWKVALPIIVIFVILLLAVVLIRRGKSKKKVRRMTMHEKVEKVNALARQFGFCYVADWDMFTTLRDAWQRTFGYEALYDRAAPSAHMVMDTLPVYFDYEGRTWLIEFWKGQYGINTGGEIGVYHADEIVPQHRYRSAHFDAVSDEEMPWIKSRLDRKGKTVYAYEKRHWWLTGFRMGMFSRSKDLTLHAAITFENYCMAEAFCQGLQRSCARCDSYEHCGCTVYVCMNCGCKKSCFTKIRSAWAQFWNRIGVCLFRMVTAPFCNTADRLLFLYYQLPRCVRYLLNFDRKRYCCRRKKRHELS